MSIYQTVFAKGGMELNIARESDLIGGTETFYIFWELGEWSISITMFGYYFWLGNGH